MPLHILLSWWVLLYFVSCVEGHSKFKLVLNSNEHAISKIFQNEKKVSLFQNYVGPKTSESAQLGLACLLPTQPSKPPRLAWLGLRCPHDEPSPNQARAAALRKILPFFVIFNGICSESKQKSRRIVVRIAHELLELVSLYKKPSAVVFPIQTELKP
jgi:hypothetical protein